jgi:antitoxin StbD
VIKNIKIEEVKKMIAHVELKDMLNSIVPISRFNKGEANKIFQEVDKTGYKIVVKNNKPICVLINPKKYEEMMTILEDAELYIEAEKRMKATNENNYISHEDIIKNLSIREEEFDDIEVKID